MISRRPHVQILTGPPVLWANTQLRPPLGPWRDLASVGGIDSCQERRERAWGPGTTGVTLGVKGISAFHPPPPGPDWGSGGRWQWGHRWL